MARTMARSHKASQPATARVRMSAQLRETCCAKRLISSAAA